MVETTVWPLGVGFRSFDVYESYFKFRAFFYSSSHFTQSKILSMTNKVLQIRSLFLVFPYHTMLLSLGHCHGNALSPDSCIAQSLTPSPSLSLCPSHLLMKMYLSTPIKITELLTLPNPHPMSCILVF